MGRWIPTGCCPLEGGTTGIPEAEERRRFVEGFAGGIVDRSTEPLEIERRMEME